MGTMEKMSGNFRVLTGTTSSGVVHCFAPVRLSIRMLFQDISVDCKSRTTATERRERWSWTTKVPWSPSALSPCVQWKQCWRRATWVVLEHRHYDEEAGCTISTD